MLYILIFLYNLCSIGRVFSTILCQSNMVGLFKLLVHVLVFDTLEVRLKVVVGVESVTLANGWSVGPLHCVFS